MDLEYFKEHIEDELCGAKDYIIRSMEVKPMNVEWAKKLSSMALNEMQHATMLYELYTEYYKILIGSYTNVPDYIQENHNCITKMYSDMYPQIKVMYDMAVR